MDVAAALADLTELSSQVRRVAVIGADGAVLGTAPEGTDADSLARAALDVVSAAAPLRADGDVTRVEISLDEGALFVLREGGRIIAATTEPRPTAHLVAYDLRTALDAIASEPAPAPKKPRATRTRKKADPPVETGEGGE
jgi:predicted regulator of Ras-like GTPase activity (Roadblock/LC7/MglB family)